MPLALTVDYATPDAFLEAMDLELANGGLLVRGAQVPPGETECTIEVRVAGESIGALAGRVAHVARTGVAVSVEALPPELTARAAQYRSAATGPAPEPEEEPAEPARAQPRGTITERIAALTVPQRVQLALSGDREARIALLRDHNKTLHSFVLRNPRIGLDEVVFAAKLNTLSPDALKEISEHPQWGQSSQIQIALVRNPRSPLPVALRLLPRLPSTEIRAIGKGGARDQLVFAARKLLSAGA